MFGIQKHKTGTTLILVHKTYYSQKHWLTFSATPSFEEEVSVLKHQGQRGFLSQWATLPICNSSTPTLTSCLVSTQTASDASNAHANLLSLPAAGVLSKLVHEPSPIDPFQDLPLVVIPKGGGRLVSSKLKTQRWLLIDANEKSGSRSLFVLCVCVNSNDLTVSLDQIVGHMRWSYII